MTVRPRYTARMKARDLATAYGRMWTTVAPVLTGLALGMAHGTRRVLTARYTDPKETA